MKLLRILMFLSFGFSQELIEAYSFPRYMYLTQDEFAGGGPFVFDNPSLRRQVNFNSGDVIQGVIQTNGTLKISQWGCPDFSNA